jgi:four helix bundle protein
MGDYKRLDAWKLASELAIHVYNLTFKGKLAKDFPFRDQMRRAVISVPSNIAEGEESGFDKVGVRYFNQAKASLAELNSQIIIAYKIKYIEVDDFQETSEKISSISKMLRKLIDYRINFNKKK